MNPLQPIEDQLRSVVQAIAARADRKRAMQEELLSHLHLAYEEEGSRLSEEQAAAEAALARMGNISDLQRQLQSSVPLFEQFIYSFRKRISMTQRIWILVGVLGFLFGMALVLPAWHKANEGGGFNGFGWLGSTIVLASFGAAIYGIKSRRMRSA